jgi:hypothetical protein
MVAEIDGKIVHTTLRKGGRDYLRKLFGFKKNDVLHCENAIL